MPAMTEKTYDAVLDCWNAGQDDALTETSYQFKIFDDFYYQLFAPIYD